VDDFLCVGIITLSSVPQFNLKNPLCGSYGSSIFSNLGLTWRNSKESLIKQVYLLTLMDCTTLLHAKSTTSHRV